MPVETRIKWPAMSAFLFPPTVIGKTKIKIMLYLNKLKNIKNVSHISVKKMFFIYYILMTILSLSILIYVTSFLYKNFYQTITQSEEIIILKKEVASEDISMDKFEKMISNIEKKKEAREIRHILRF